MDFETVTILIVAFGGLLFVIANDWWKRRLVRRAAIQGRDPRASWTNNETHWGAAIGLAVAFVVFIYVMQHKELIDGDWGVFTPLVQWFLAPPPSARP